MKFTNVFFLSLMLLLFSFSASDLLAQNEWRFLKNADKVALSYRIENCNGVPKVLLMLKNEAKEAQQLVWKIRYKFAGSDWVEMPQEKQSFTINANTSAVGECMETRTNHALSFFIKTEKSFEIEVLSFGKFVKQ
jgi:hypothetical protein